MSDVPSPVIVEGNALHSETFVIPKQPTAKDAMKLMDTVSRFLTKLAVELLTEESAGKPIFPASHPGPVTILQAAAVLQGGHGQMEMIAAQNAQLASPGRGPQGPFRTN